MQAIVERYLLELSYLFVTCYTEY